MAKNFKVNMGERGQWKVFSRKGSYRGATRAALALGASPTDGFGPPSPGVIQVSQANEYQCIYCRNQGGCDLEFAREVEGAREHEGPSTVPAFIGELISVVASVNIPHPEH